MNKFETFLLEAKDKADSLASEILNMKHHYHNDNDDYGFVAYDTEKDLRECGDILEKFEKLSEIKKRLEGLGWWSLLSDIEKDNFFDYINIDIIEILLDICQQYKIQFNQLINNNHSFEIKNASDGSLFFDFMVKKETAEHIEKINNNYWIKKFKDYHNHINKGYEYITFIHQKSNIAIYLNY
jgi:hypothetical protein